MSRENVEVVRQPITVADHPRRRAEQHLVRFPRALALFARATWRLYLWLPPRSWLRQAMARRYTQQAVEALNRQDLEAAFALYHPDVESIFDQRLGSLGAEPAQRGLEARVDFQRRWNAEWGDWRFDPDELIDLGDGRQLIAGRAGASGVSSGAPVDSEFVGLATFSAGRVIREQIFFNRAEALEAVGLRE